MERAATLEAQIRRRAYDLYQRRTQVGGNQIDDWLQAERDVRSQSDGTNSEAPQRAWTDIEPVLKWGAVAYAFGFFTVMIHTRKLGLPVLELTEPINIWIGLPLAIVAFFLDKIWNVIKKSQERLREDLETALQQRDSMKNWSTPQQLYDSVIEVLDQTRILFRPGSHWLPKKAFRRILEKRFLRAPDGGAAMLRIWGRMLFSLRTVSAVRAFNTVTSYVVAILVACVVYVSAIYPVIPQSMGGGKPTTVRLIVNTEKIPRGAEVIRAMFPTEATTRQQATNEPKASETVAVILHYQTDHAYYVSLRSGPIISLDHDAVDGIIFENRTGP